MGKYTQKIAGLFHGGDEQNIRLTGEKFELDAESISRFRTWWGMINLAHLMVFWGIGAVSMLLLMLLAFATTFGTSGNAEGINFVLTEGRAIGRELFPLVGTLFLLTVSVMLFQTQLGVMDSTSRIMAENAAIAKLSKDPDGRVHLSKIYYFFVWAQVIFGIVLFSFGLHEPRTLIVLGAVINAFAMFVHVGLVAWLNRRSLPKAFQPNLARKLVILGIFIFFGFFSGVVLWDKLGLVN